MGGDKRGKKSKDQASKTVRHVLRPYCIAAFVVLGGFLAFKAQHQEAKVAEKNTPEGSVSIDERVYFDRALLKAGTIRCCDIERRNVSSLSIDEVPLTRGFHFRITVCLLSGISYTLLLSDQSF